MYIMIKYSYLTYGSICATLLLSSCNNTESTKEKSTQPVEATTPEADSHAGHDHGATDAHASAPSTTQPAAQMTSKEPIAYIAPFKFYKVKSGVSFTNDDISKGKKTVFILFDPGCHHCRDEAGALSSNYAKLKDINLYFVSMNDPALMASFLETFGKELVGKPNVQVLYDRNQDFIQKFHVPSQFPANYIYDKDGKLQAYWEGDKNINEIITAYNK